MRSPRFLIYRKFLGLWLLTLGLSTLVLGWDSLAHRFAFREIPLIGLLDRNILALKLDLEDSFFASRYKPAKEISILQLKYPNRADFWFDQATKQSLSGHLKDFSGVVLLNIDSEAALRDKVLSSLFDNPNIIRNFRFHETMDFDAGIEDRLAKTIHQGPATGLSQPVQIIPKDPRFFENTDKFMFGASLVGFESTTHLIYDFPLAIRGAELFLPSNVLTAHLRLSGARADLTDDQMLAIDGQRLPLRLPLRPYSKQFSKISLEDIKSLSSTTILIVDITDDFSTFRDFRGRRTSWSSLAATALSNLKQNHLMISPPSAGLATGLILALLLGWLVWAATQKLQTLLIAHIGGAALFVLADLVISVGFGVRTHPVPEFLTFFLISAVAIATRAILDSHERRLVDRALSGYVSEVRLKRIISGREMLKLEGRTAKLSTLLFDLAGFSKISKHLSPDKTFELIQHVYAITDPIVFEHHGVIDKKTGDGFLAFFGDFIEDDGDHRSSHAIKAAAVDACLCALKIQEALHAAEFRGFSLPEEHVQARIGINTGTMMIGNAGSSLHFNYTVLGEAVNFTQRLEAACPHGSVLVGPATADLVDSEFDVVPRQISIKGEDAPYTAYELKSKKSPKSMLTSRRPFAS